MRGMISQKQTAQCPYCGMPWAELGAIITESYSFAIFACGLCGVWSEAKCSNSREAYEHAPQDIADRLYEAAMREAGSAGSNCALQAKIAEALKLLPDLKQCMR